MARISKRAKFMEMQRGKVWYFTALYIRLSHEETEADPTEKIQNQKELLLRFIAEKTEFRLVGIYCDNGFTGRNFDRPQWKKLMEDVKNRRVDCIIVKDLSRLGRNYIEAGDYLEKVFPFLGVRFIAVSDGYDSNVAETQNMDMMLPLKNIINASYAKDLSQKIRSARHMQRMRGEYTGSRLPYGYKRDPRRKGKLVVNEKEAFVVKMIFSRIAEGHSCSETARELNRMGICAPQGKLWSYQTIKVITANEIYVGTLTQGKRCVSGSDPVALENALEAIIDRETFLKAAEQKSRRSVKRSDIHTGEGWLFRGMLKAANSGKKLYKAPYLKKGGTVMVKAYRSPKAYNENGTAYKLVMIREETLLSCLKTTIFAYLDILNGIKEFLESSAAQKYYEKKQQKADARINQLEKLLERERGLLTGCYEDMADGVLDWEGYRTFRQHYQEEAVRLERELQEEQEERKKLTETIGLKNPYLTYLEQFGEDETITKSLMEHLVREILVFGYDEVKIQFTFADEFQQLQEVADGGYEHQKDYCAVSEDLQTG